MSKLDKFLIQKVQYRLILLLMQKTRSTETSNGLAAIQAQLNNLGREIKKVNEKVYAAQVGCEQCKGPHYTKDYPLKEEGKTLKEAYYTQFGGPFEGGGYRAAAPGFYQRNNERGFGSLPSSTESNPRDHVKSILTTAEANSNPIRRIGSPQYAVSTPQNRRFMFESRQTTIPFLSRELAHTKLIVELADRTVKYCKRNAEDVLVGIGKFVFLVDFIILNMPEDVKVPLILRRPFLSTAHAKIDVFKRKIALIFFFKSIKSASSLIKRVYMLSLKEIMELDLEARLMGETLVLNRSLDSSYGDYIELNDLNIPLELRRDQVDDLMPTIKEGEVIDEPMIDIIKTRNKELMENMDGYRDQDMGYIILGEPFCKASCVDAR
ncbi:ribonuclease H-like domain-containing protein, partial [Tanacetum coccineum]